MKVPWLPGMTGSLGVRKNRWTCSIISRSSLRTAARETLIRKGYAPQELRHDTFTGDAMFFVMDPDGLPVEIHE